MAKETKRKFTKSTNGLFIEYFDKRPNIGDEINFRYISDADFYTESGVRWLKFLGGGCRLSYKYEDILPHCMKDERGDIWVQCTIAADEPVGKLVAVESF